MSAAYDELSILEYSGQLQAEISQSVRAFSRQWKASIFDSILETHVLSELQLRDALARALQLNTCDEITVPAGWKPYHELVNYRFARQNLWLVGSADTNSDSPIFAFVANPITLGQLKDILSRQDLVVQVAERSEVIRAIDFHYPLASQLGAFSQDIHV